MMTTTPRLDWRGVNLAKLYRSRARLGFSPARVVAQPIINDTDAHAIAHAGATVAGTSTVIGHTPVEGTRALAAEVTPKPSRSRRRRPGSFPRAPRLPRLQPLLATEAPSGAAQIKMKGHTYIVLALDPHHALLGRVTGPDTFTARATFVLVPISLVKITRAIQLTMTPAAKASSGAGPGAAVVFRARKVLFQRSSGSVAPGQLVLDGPFKNYVCNDAMREHLEANVTVSVYGESSGLVFTALQHHMRQTGAFVHLYASRMRCFDMDAFGTMKPCGPEIVRRMAKSGRTRTRLRPTRKCKIRGVKPLLTFLAEQLQRESVNASEVALLRLAMGGTPPSGPAVAPAPAPAVLVCNGMHARVGSSWADASKCRCGLRA